MQTYTLFGIRAGRDVIQEECLAATDDAVITLAAGLFPGAPTVEVWCGPRLVANLTRGSLAAARRAAIGLRNLATA